MLIRKLIPVMFLSRLIAVYKRIFYFGLRYKCPLCNSWLRTFLPFGLTFPVIMEKKIVGAGFRQNALCPICGSLDRERFLYLYLLHNTDVFVKPKKLLHVAPEARLASIFQLKANVDYLTADISSENVMIKMDITDIHFPEGFFDVIICNHVLEHIIDDRKAMSELYRTLKPGGWAILQVPLSLSLDSTYEDFSVTTKSGREEVFGQGDHVRIYAKDYQNRLAQAGFRVNVFKWAGERNFGGPKNIFGINEDECVYFVSKLQ